MSVIINGDTGITTPAEIVQGALTTTGNTILGDASTDTLNVGNGGLVKDASGNVGIGTASPLAKLDINSTSAAADIRLSVAGALYANIYANSYALSINSISAIPLSLGTNNTEQASISSTGLLQFNSGYGSVATAYGCRAWVNFNGTGTVAINASGNVSSITDVGTGNYTVNFTTAMPDAQYTPVRSDNGYGAGETNIISASAVSIRTSNFAAVYIDPSSVRVAIIR
jgi:hypothetical protein